MQAVTIFFPIYEAYKSQTETHNTLGVLKEWEEKRAAEKLDSSSRKHTRNSGSSAEDSASSSRPGSYWSLEMYGTAALENALVTESHSLLQFAATRDFTAENIIFLLQLQSWRAAFGTGSRKLADLPAHTRSHLFRIATGIYTVSVSEKTAEFPINIEGPIRTRLDAVFKSAATESAGRSDTNTEEPGNPVAPFDFSPIETPSKFGGNLLMREIDTSYMDVVEAETTATMDDSDTTESDDSVPDFDERVFDAAEKSIKYLVLTNTWRKFVDEKREQSSNGSSEELR
jgi:hypothetical protein